MPSEKWDHFGRFWTTYFQLPMSSIAFRTILVGKYVSFVFYTLKNVEKNKKHITKSVQKSKEKFEISSKIFQNRPKSSHFSLGGDALGHNFLPHNTLEEVIDCVIFSDLYV